MKLTILLPLSLLGFLLASCEKVIELNLSDTKPRIVIQGTIYDQPGPYVVTISKTVGFDQPNVFPPVKGASVKIIDNHGHEELLDETEPGRYVASEIQGVPGYTYRLMANIDGTTYTAVATMPLPVDIDTIYVEKSLFGGLRLPTVEFLDPETEVNYYRLIEFVNNKQQHDFHVVSDDLYNGLSIKYTLFSFEGNLELNPSDDVTVWLEGIDKGVYEYFRTAGNSGSQSASPSNPTSNFGDGVLGYFSACTLRKASVTVTED